VLCQAKFEAVDIEELERDDQLPWGLHDACIERVAIDWMSSPLVIEARVKVDERQTTERRLQITVLDLIYCAMEAPEIDPARGYRPVPPGGLWIDSGAVKDPHPRELLPATPEGAFLQRFFVHDWNRSIVICARDARLKWLDVAPAPTLVASGFALPGDEIPDPARSFIVSDLAPNFT
jgi:hypothetical protein